LTVFSPNGFVILDFLRQGDSFIDQILKPLSQEHSTKSADIACRRLRLRFANFRCHTTKIVSEEMSYLKCKRGPHRPYSPNRAIANFYFFAVLKQELQGIDGSDGEELKREILRIFQGIPANELKKSFDHWIERHQWVATNAGSYCPP
jgi:hypothetical protein